MAAQKRSKGLTIGKLAELSGVSCETIRYYEREGLMPPPGRTRSNYRIYGSNMVDRLLFIRRAKDLGFTLMEIRHLLDMSVSVEADAGVFHDLAQEKIQWIEERIRQFEHMRDVLKGALVSCPGHGADKSECPILGLFMEEAVNKEAKKEISE